MKNLETERLYLIHPKLSDVDLVLSFYEQNKEHFEPYEPKRSPNFYTLSYQRSVILAEIAKENTDSFLRFYLYLKSNPDTIIGSISVSEIKQSPFFSCVLGYKLDYQYCNHGYAFEALNKVMQYMITVHHIHRLEAYIMPVNLRSKQLIERLGFQFDGICTEYAIVGEQWENHERYTYLTSL